MRKLILCVVMALLAGGVCAAQETATEREAARGAALATGTKVKIDHYGSQCGKNRIHTHSGAFRGIPKRFAEGLPAAHGSRAEVTRSLVRLAHRLTFPAHHSRLP